jgi:hypothetical protein
MHRDHHSENWMIIDNKPVLLDFGTAIELGEDGFT